MGWKQVPYTTINAVYPMYTNTYFPTNAEVHFTPETSQIPLRYQKNSHLASSLSQPPRPSTPRYSYADIAVFPQDSYSMIETDLVQASRVDFTSEDAEGGLDDDVVINISMRDAGVPQQKRESHRQKSSAPTAQSGSHRCGRINPSTGKPCNSTFSRLHGLTRHVKTIHESNKFRCQCNEKKTFSRKDSLTRHIRKKHLTQP
jgi:hypothetical protein